MAKKTRPLPDMSHTDTATLREIALRLTDWIGRNPGDEYSRRHLAAIIEEVRRRAE